MRIWRESYPSGRRVSLGDCAQMPAPVDALSFSDSPTLFDGGQLVRIAGGSGPHSRCALRVHSGLSVGGISRPIPSIEGRRCFGLILCFTPALLRHRSGPHPSPCGTCRSASFAAANALRVWVSKEKSPAQKHARLAAQKAGEIFLRTHPRKHACGTWEPGPSPWGALSRSGD